MAVPISEKNWVRFGVSSTPTLVLVDRSGTVKLYHPGQMGEAELAREIEALL
jgi:thioredoxin-related protein